MKPPPPPPHTQTQLLRAHTNKHATAGSPTGPTLNSTCQAGAAVLHRPKPVLQAQLACCSALQPSANAGTAAASCLRILSLLPGQGLSAAASPLCCCCCGGCCLVEWVFWGLCPHLPQHVPVEWKSSSQGAKTAQQKLKGGCLGIEA